MRFLDLGPGVTAAVAKANDRRLGWSIQGSCQLTRRAPPDTPADSGGPALRSGAAVPGTVPQPVPMRIRSRHRGPSHLRRAHGRGGSSGGPSWSGGGAAAGSGGLGGGCLGTRPVYRGQLRAEPVHPPTHPRGAAGGSRRGSEVRGHGRRPLQAAGCRGCAEGARSRTRGPVTTGCHRCGRPRGLRFGAGAPAAPRLRGARSGSRRTPPWRAACGGRPGRACGPGPSTPWPCPAGTPAG